MFLLESEELEGYARHFTNKDIQRHKLHLDLTVAEIHQYTGAGSLDFSGSEFMPSPSIRIDSEKRSHTDTYGWWTLGPGTYYAVMNEELQQMNNMLAIIAPHPYTRRAGIVANTGVVGEENYEKQLKLEFQVPKCGVNIKENARFAVLSILKIG